MAGVDELYERVSNAPAVPRGLSLVVLLTGFTDAGSTVSALVRRFHEAIDTQPLVCFENDILLDYRARRPIITFDEDHLSDYAPARLELSLAHDALGQPFLLLAGYEPDFAWEGFARAVLKLAAEYRVADLTWIHAIPMPVPHTREMTTTVSGNRAELIAEHSVWQPRTQVPGTAGHLLEYRFSEEGYSVASFVMLVPHYLAESEYPASQIAALEKITKATGLVFASDDLREEERGYLQRVNEEVAQNDELGSMLTVLEERFDSYMAALDRGASDISAFAGPLPSADELAAELERFLARRDGFDDLPEDPPAS